MQLEAAIPVLRIFDPALALAFYRDWLGLNLDWEHRFDPEAPIYMQLSRGALTLHLSQHYGDCTPGSKLVIYVDDIDALHAELHSRPHPHMRPGVELAPWGAKVMDITDPFGNRLSFMQLLDAPA